MIKTKKLILLFKVILVSLCLLIVVICSLSYIYTFVRFPSPRPYPGLEVVQSHPVIGSGRREIKYEYSVDLTLVEIQQYYEEEMKQYCEDGWQFEETENACTDFISCRVANCEIPRPFVEDAQFFLIYLRSISETRTNVIYFQTTNDP